MAQLKRALYGAGIYFFMNYVIVPLSHATMRHTFNLMMVVELLVHMFGERPRLDFKPREHDEIGVALGLLDFERARKISGTRFVVRIPLAS